MANLLRFGTAVVVHIGPAIATGGLMAVTTLKASTVTALRILKHGSLASVVGTTVTGRTFTHKSDGYYTLSLLSGDVNTYGHLTAYVRASGAVKALAMWQKFQVVPTNIYDSHASGTSKQNVGTLSSGLSVWAVAARTLTSGGAPATSVWAAAARTLSSAGVVWTAAARGLTSKVGYALTSAQHDSIGARAWQTTITAVTGAPGASPVAASALGWVYVASRNKRITTATADKIHSGVSVGIAKAPISATSLVFTRGKYLAVTG